MQGISTGHNIVANDASMLWASYFMGDNIFYTRRQQSGGCLRRLAWVGWALPLSWAHKFVISSIFWSSNFEISNILGSLALITISMLAMPSFMAWSHHYFMARLPVVIKNITGGLAASKWPLEYRAFFVVLTWECCYFYCRDPWMVRQLWERGWWPTAICSREHALFLR